MRKKFTQKMEGMTLATPMEDVRDFGEIVSNSEGKITIFKEKLKLKRSGYINGGVYLFLRRITSQLSGMSFRWLKHFTLFKRKRN